MMTPDVLSDPFEHARKIVEPSDPLSRIAQLTKTIGQGIRREPAYAFLAVAGLYFAAQIGRGIYNQSIRFNNLADSQHNNSSVVFPDRAYWPEGWGDRIPTGPVGVRVIDREGVNVRNFPDRELGGRVKTGQDEPYYKVLQFHQYAKEPIIQVSDFIRRGEDIWAVQWTEKDEGYKMELFAVCHNGEWLADFRVDSGEFIPGDLLFRLKLNQL